MVVIVIVVAFVVVVVVVVAVVVVVVFLLCLVFFFLSALLQKGGSSLDTKVGVCPGWLLGTFPASCPGHALSKQMPCFFLVSIWRQLGWQSVFSVFKGYISRTPARLAKYFTTNLSKVHAVSCSIYGGGARLSARSHHARINAPATSSTSPPTAEHVSMTKSVLRWEWKWFWSLQGFNFKNHYWTSPICIGQFYPCNLGWRFWPKQSESKPALHVSWILLRGRSKLEAVKFEWSIFAGIFTPFALDRTEVRCFQPCERQTLSWLKVHRAPKSVISKPDLLYLAGPRSAEGDAAGLYCVCVCVWHMNREYIYIYGM